MAASRFLKSIAKKINNKSVIANLDFGLQNGDRLAVIGANGCGKTPLLKIVAGIVDADSGQIFIDGEEFNSKKYDLAFRLYPTKISEVLVNADKKKYMPQKSTWFNPKPLDGLISSNIIS